MTIPGKVSHGLAVEVSPEDGATVVDHNGAIEGFVAHMAYLPESHVGPLFKSWKPRRKQSESTRNPWNADDSSYVFGIAEVGGRRFDKLKLHEVP